MGSGMMMQLPTDRHTPPATSLVPFLPAPRRLDVIKPLLGDLETATTAGQHYVMGKVLAQLREAAAAAERKLSEPQRRAIQANLAVLEHESERLLPNADAFGRSARLLAATLSPT
jgi:hypothetical protein